MANATILVTLPCTGISKEAHDLLNVQLIQHLLSSLCVTHFRGCTVVQVSDGLVSAYPTYAVDFSSMDTLRTARFLAKSLGAAFPTLEGVGYLYGNLKFPDLKYIFVSNCGEFDEPITLTAKADSYNFAIHLDEHVLYYVPVQS